MRLRSIKKHTASAAWLLMALLTFAPLGHHAAAVVLCFGADGHVAAERADGAFCAASEADTLPLASGGSRGEAAGQPGCTDVPLPSGGDSDCASYKTESGPTAQITLPLVAVLSAPHHSQASSVPAPSALGEEATLPSDPLLLRSVVLLI